VSHTYILKILKSLNTVTGVYYTATGRVLSLVRSDFQKI
jgi:hypothetical protein